MKQPKKWREGIDPFQIKFKKFKLLKVLGYPYAGNDVFYCKGLFEDKVIFCFLKVARQKDNDIKNEIQKLRELKIKHIPKIVEFNEDDFSYIITKKIQGKRLSNLVGDNKNMESLHYMFKFGKALAEIHELDVKVNRAKERKFNFIPDEEYCKEFGFQYVRNWLIKNKPTSQDLCFCHGDFHYANLLWKNENITGILDWEMSGENVREYDVAWSLILRPDQKFMNTEQEFDEFIKGYKSIHKLNIEYVRYYMIQFYLYFYKIGRHSSEYQTYIKNFFEKYCI